MTNPKWLSVVNAGDSGPAIIRISGFIGESFWDDNSTSEKAFLSALDSIPAGQKIELQINSEGGSIQDGLGIYNAIRSRSADITAKITGYALSIASVIPLAASRVISPKTAVWMIHKPWTQASGNADQMRKVAELLDKHEEALVAAYVAGTEQHPEKIKEDLERETWMSGAEAVAYGLADEEVDEPVALACITDKSRYRRMPAAMGAVTPPPQENTNKQESDMDPNATPNAAVEANTPQAKNDHITTPEAAALARAIADLSTEVRNLKPVANPPLAAAAAVVENLGDAHDKFSAMSAGNDRRDFLVKAWGDIMRSGQRKPQASNTISATLTTALLSDTVVTVLQNRLAPIGALFTEVMLDPMKPMATVQVPKVTGGATAQTDPTDWESGNTTVTNTAVTMHEYSVSYHVTNAELQSGTRMEWLAKINAAVLANKILDVIAVPLTVANYGAACLTSSSTAFGASDLRTIWSAAKDFTLRNLVLDGAYWAQLIPTDTLGFGLNQGSPGYGFDGIWYSNRWSAADSNVVGFVASPEAMVIAAGLPIDPPGANTQYSSIGSAVIPGINVPIQTSSWLKPGTRVQWQALDLLLGVAACDTSALELIKSA